MYSLEINRNINLLTIVRIGHIYLEPKILNNVLPCLWRRLYSTKDWKLLSFSGDSEVVQCGLLLGEFERGRNDKN